MNSLKVPESGLQLEGSGGKDSHLPPQAFALTLNDDVIENMIKCVQNGDEIQLAMGANPTFRYGSHKHVIAPPTESHPSDVYLTKPFESTRKAQKLPHTSSLFEKPKSDVPLAKSSTAQLEREPGTKAKAAKPKKSGGSQGLDSDIKALQNGIAAHAAAQEKAFMVDKLPANKKGVPKTKNNKLLPGSSSTPRSIPGSPAAIHTTGLASPIPAVDFLEQHRERSKEQRVTLVHELAVEDRALGYLKERWAGKEEDLRPTLEKVADYLPGSQNWAMKKAHWKELDVWNYDYDTQELRQKAIDNAIRQYDRQRLSSSEPEWQRLLPKEERGQGKCLSRLQANIAKGPPPKIKVHKADGGSTPRGDSDVDGVKPKAGGEGMSRSASNPLPSKPKKSATDAQYKRLLGNSKSKASASRVSASKVSAPKASAPKVSPTKAKATGSKPNGGRVLSKEIIDNSDSSGEEGGVVQPKTYSKVPASKPVARPAGKTKDTVVAKARPVKKEPVKQQTTKRPREDDDSSSSSGTPLSKRIKPKQSLQGPPLKHRPSDASQHSRGTTNSSFKSKNTSPTKSSPLASSPPTNASDLENEAPPIVTKKRKADDDGKASRAKRVSLSNDLLDKAEKFKTYYEKYETLHYEILALEDPPKDRLARLLDLRGQLLVMKREIYKDCPPEKE